MNMKSKYSKVIKTLSICQEDIWSALKMLAPLENSFHTETVNDEEACIVPNEANFQLPNVFLRTAPNPGYQKLVNCSVDAVEWNKTVDEVAEMFEEMEIVSTTEVMVQRCPVVQDVLKRMMCERYGYR
ncbi:hypothetical protein HK407_02g03650 [Ordospora pajunii]|jgi:hypothetical protein|uniref:uncharacterized protein n=1 Tax=Ordospora pajunii TaxID=3039483 RepID=UPI00295291CA|nr:uncharacterized protein HK407_02g03650 [Ordospora pajunii]KAH9411920.1 hypothetical protein HK407_02g03650 [Ordospora pajunii]